MREGGAGRANPQMCIQERLLGFSRPREGVRGLPSHAHHLCFLGLGRGSVGMGVCVCKALGRTI